VVRTGDASFVLILATVLALQACAEDPELMKFDAERARELVRKQVSFGPRVPGTASHGACGDWLVQQLEPLADQVEIQEFTGVVAGRSRPMRNIVARFNPQRRPRVLLGAHWDSRPISDHDPERRLRGDPTPGANDSGSGVAVLLELARMMAACQLPLGVDLVLFDGEDQGDFNRGLVEVLLGSQHFARSVRKADYRFAIVVDMVGREGLSIRPEGYSVSCCPDLVDRIWSLAEGLGHGAVFPRKPRSPIIDDHLPLQRAGMRAVDLIDLDDPNWHTTRDTPDKISAGSLAAVGEVLWALLLEEAGLQVPLQTEGVSAASADSGKRAR
jgi:hypothetical protein